MADYIYGQPDAADESNPYGKPAPKPSGALRKAVGDKVVGFASGAVGATKAIADAVGAGNVVSNTLENANQGINDYLSPEAKADQQAHFARSEQAKGTGAWNEFKTGVQNFAESPIQQTVTGAGSIVPVALAALGGLPAAAATGIAMGAGTVKGRIYDDTKKRGIDAGLSAADADAAATKAQNYTGENTDQIALGGALGAADALTGAGRVAGGMLRNAVMKPAISAIPKAVERGIVGRAAMGALGEFPLEAAQGGQEQLATNIAAQRQGVNVDTWSGVAGQATEEGLASLGYGAAFGVARGRNANTAPPGVVPPPAVPPAPPLQIGNTPDPYISFPDGTVARQSEADAYVNSLPADQQPAARAKLMGLAPQPAKPSEQMGLTPTAGPSLTNAAITAVDSGAAQVNIDQAPAEQTDIVEQQRQQYQQETAALLAQQDQEAFDAYLAAIEDANTALDEAPGESVQALSQLDDISVPDIFDANSNTSDADFLRAMGATEQEIADAITNQPGSPQAGTPNPVGTAQDEPGSTGQGVSADQTKQANLERIRKANNVSPPDSVQPIPATSSGQDGNQPAASVGLGSTDGNGLGANAAGSESGAVGQSGEQASGALRTPVAQGRQQPTTLGTQTSANAGPGFSAKDVQGVKNQSPAATDPQAGQAPVEAPQAVAGDAAPAGGVPAAGGAAVEGDGVAQEPLPPTDIRIGDAVIVDGKPYRVAQGIDGGIAVKSESVDIGNGVSVEKTKFLKGDDAIRAKIAADKAGLNSQPAQPVTGEGAGVSQPTQGAKPGKAGPASLGSAKADMDYLFGIDQKRTKALDRIAAGKAWWTKPLDAQEFITKNGLKDTHQSVKEGGKWYVRAKAVSQPTKSTNEKATEAQPQQAKPEAGTTTGVPESAAVAAGSGVDEGLVVTQGKGLIKGKFLSSADGSGTPGGPWATESEALNAAKDWREKRKQDAATMAADLDRKNSYATKLRDGHTPTSQEVEGLGLRAAGSELTYFIPRAAELFGITSRQVRPLIADLIRVGTTDMGSKIESVNPIKALAQIAKTQSTQDASAANRAKLKAKNTPNSQDSQDSQDSLDNTKVSQPPKETNGTQAAQTVQATQEGSQPPAAAVEPISNYALPKDSKVHEDWRKGESNGFQPDARQQLVMDATKKALDDGLFYTNEVVARVASILNVPKDILDQNKSKVEGGDFGYDVYMARKAVESKAAFDSARKTAEEMQLKPGDSIGVIVTQDGKKNTSVVVESVGESGLSVTITGKRGIATVKGKMGVDALKNAIENAHKKGVRKAGYAEFLKGRDAASSKKIEGAISNSILPKAPQSPAEPAPVATESVATAREAIEHVGVKIYPVTFKGEPRWSVQTEDNRTNGKVLGDTIHATLEDAKAEAERQVVRVKSQQERSAAHEAEEAAAQAKKETNKGKSIIERKRDAYLDKQHTYPPQAGLGQGTRREAMQKAVDQGRAIVERMVPDTAAKHRDQTAIDLVKARGFILGLSNENIPVVKQGLEAQARMKANQYEKPEYRIYDGRDRNGSFREISKTEYDYAKSLAEKAKDPHENYIKSAADSIARLRKSDVYRVLDSLAKDNIDGVTREGLADYIKKNHPDYAQEVDDVLAELSGATLEPHQMTEAQYGEQERQKALADMRADLDKAKSGEMMPYARGAKSKAELVRNIEADIAKTEQSNPERFAGDHLGHINKALRDGKTVPVENLKRYDVQPQNAVHQDPGKAPEVATAPVIAQSLAKAARKEDHTQKEMRLWLVGEIDKAVKLTEDYADYQESIKKNGQSVADSVFYGKASDSVGLTTPPGKSTVTFDVPGDGKFKIRNSLRGLMEFRAKVEGKSGTGFTDKPTKPKGLPASTGVAKGSTNQIEALSNMLEELDFEAAVDYARETGVSLNDAKVAPHIRDQLNAYLKDGTLPPPPFSPSRYWEYQASSRADKDGNPIREASLTKEIGADTYVANVAGTNATGFKFTVTKNGDPFEKQSGSYGAFSDALQGAESKINAIQPEVVRPKDTGWNMRGTGYAGKRYIGRNITLDDGREVVARIYENAGQYEEAEVKVDGARVFAKTDHYKAEKLADDFIATLTAKEQATDKLDLKGFTRTPKGNGEFDLVDGNLYVTVKPTAYGFQANHGMSAKSGPRLTEQQAIEWAAALRDESKRIQAREAKPAEPAKTFRNPDTLNVLHAPIEDKDWFKLKNGEEWQARQGYSGRGWSLVRNGNLHPEARNFESQSDFIRSVIEVTGQTQAPGQVAAPAETNDEPIPAVTEAQARKQFEWRNMGQKDGTKSHLLFFFESEKDKGTGAAMNQGEVSLYPGDRGWKVEDGDGTSYKSLADAKKAAIDAAIPILQEQGYVLKPAQAATAILDAANITGKERVDALKDVKKGDITPEELEAAYPAKVAAKPKDRNEADANIQNGNATRELTSFMKDESNAVNHAEKVAEWRKQYAGNHAETIAAGDISRSDYEKLSDLVRRGGVTEQRAIEMIESAASAGVLDKGVADNMRKKVGAAQEAQPAAEGKPAAQDQAKPKGPAVIEDTGEKLGGARKDQAPSLKTELSDDDISSQPLSKIWPADEYLAIDDTFASAVAFAARQEIPSKPRASHRVAQWVKNLKTVRHLAQMISGSEVTQERFAAKVGESPGLRNFMDKVVLLEAIDRSQWPRISSVEVYKDSYMYAPDGTKVSKPLVRVVIDDKTRSFDGATSVADVVERVSAMLDTEVKLDKRMQFEVRGTEKKGYGINKKGDKEYRRLKTFPTAKEAFAYIKENYDDVVALWDGVKERDNVKEDDVRNSENRPRTGADHRQGKDVSAEQFNDTFGFRGIEFGNWVSQGKNAKERQGMLNQAYDALRDLADIVGVPPKAMSLNGSLGLGFGSRGSGKFAAHFEPDTLVINLTKTRGAGSLAHEWLHAMDNYFARQRHDGQGVSMKDAGNTQDGYRKANYVTYKPEPLYVHKTKMSTPITKAKLESYFKGAGANSYYNPENWQLDPKHPQGVRPEVERRFAELVEALDASPMATRASMNDKAPDGYWGRIIERAARSFENYVISKMLANGYQNDYLANVRDVQDFQRDAGRYPYLLPEEVAPIAEAFDNLFGTIQTKETDTGVALFSQGLLSPASFGQKPTLDQIQRLVDKVLQVAKNVVPVSVIGNPSQIAGIRVPTGAKPTGALIDGRIYLFADNIQSIGDAYVTLFHELFHLGLQKVIPAEDYATLLRQFSRNLLVQKFVREWKASPEGVEKAGTMNSAAYDALAAEEALAMVSEELSISNGIGTNRTPGLVKAMLSWIAEVVDKMGFPASFGKWIRGLTQTEAERFVSQMVSAAMGGDKNLGKTQAKYGTLASEMTAQTRLSAGGTRKPTIVYHNSSTANRASIEKNGIRGSDNTSPGGDPVVFVSDTYKPQRGMDTYAIDAKDLDLQPDDTTEAPDGEVWYAVYGDIRKTLINANNGTNPDIRFSQGLGDTLSSAANNVRNVKLPAGYKVGDLFNAVPGKLNWWHRTVGTQYNLAQRSPAFKRVYDAVQTFINDVSYFATEAADMAPNILPKLESWKDLAKSPLSAADTKALSAPVFEGTLIWARDESGKAVKMETLEAKAKTMTPEQKAQRLLRGDHISEQMLKTWKGLPIDQYERLVNDKYEDSMLKAGIVFKDAELTALFGLSDKQIALYREFRKATDKSLANLAIADMLRFGGKDADPVRDVVLESKSVKDAADTLSKYLRSLADLDPDRATVLMDTANKMIDKGDKAQGLMDRGYAPLSRFGSYTLDVVDANGERAYFGMFESAAEASRMRRKMEGLYPGSRITQGTVSEQAYKMFAGVSPETLELFGDMLGLETQGDDTASQAFQEYLKLAKSSRSAMKRLIQRKGIAGFSEDAGRVLAGFVYSNARQTATSLHMGEMTQAAADNDAFRNQGETQDAAVKLVDYIKNPQEEAQKLRGLLFAQYIGGSVASAMVNMTQPITMTFPWLSQYGGVASAAKQMTAAIKDVGKPSTGDTKLDAALRKAEEDGTVSPQEVHQLLKQSQGRSALQSDDGTRAGYAMALAQNTVSRFSLVWGKLFSVAEQFNRRVTFIAAYRTAVAQGMADPDEFARKAISETQGVYNKGNKPAWARGAVGSTLFTFKQYSIAYVEMLSRMAKSGPEGKKAALLALAVLFLLSGAGGMPGADDLDDVISGAMQAMGYNFDSKMKRKEFFVSLLGEGGAQFVERGVSGLPGVPLDVSGRMGLGNLIPGTGLLTKKADHTRDVAEIAGPAGDFVKRGFDAAGKLITGNVAGAVNSIVPKAIQNVTQAFDMANMGMYRDTKGMKVLDTDMGDAVVKAIGFQPNDVKRAQDANSEVARMIGLNKIIETEIANRWAIGIFEKDTDKVQAARDDLAEWNRSNPESPIRINFTQIRSRVQKMNQTKAERIAKTAPREIRAAVRKELADAR